MGLPAWCQAGTGWVEGMVAAEQGDKMADLASLLSSPRGCGLTGMSGWEVAQSHCPHG